MRRKGEIMKRMQKTYQTINFPPLTEEQKKELQALEEMPDEDIDYSDIPEQNGEGQFFYLSSLKLPQKDIHTKIDKDNLEWLKKDGAGYQKRLNLVIRWARLNGCPISQLV